MSFSLLRSWLRAVFFLLLIALAIPSLLAEEASEKPSPAWPPEGYEKVRLYHFSVPADSSTVIRNETLKLDMDLLRAHTSKSADVPKDQVEAVLKAISSNSPKTPNYACYNAHHVFVFFDKDDHAVGAFEVCFECLSSKHVPWARLEGSSDFRMLAKICEPLVGLEKGETAKSVSERLDHLEAEMKKEKAAEDSEADASEGPPQSATHPEKK